MKTDPLIRRIGAVIQYSVINPIQIMSAGRTESRSDQQSLTREEWDFTGIPYEELKLAEIYEYSREVKVVRDAYTDWLESEAYILDEEPDPKYEDHYPYGDGPTIYQKRDIGCSVRQLITKHNLPCELRIGGNLQEVAWSDLWEPMDRRLQCHHLSSVLELLPEWPQPYKTARKSDAVKRGINERLQTLSRPAQAVFAANSFPRPIGDKNYKALNVVVDCSLPKKMIAQEFGEMCIPYLTAKRGRKVNKTPPLLRLKQLAAHRLHDRFCGQGKTFSSFAQIEIELQRLSMDEEQAKILPIYQGQLGLSKAGDIAQRELKNYKTYKPDLLSTRGRVLVYDFDTGKLSS